MWRFKPSKYKNAAPKVPKKGEGWILDISVGSPQSYGNHIKASAAFMAFNIESPGGGNLGVLPIDDKGRKNKNLPVLHAHSGFVNDFDFSPFDDGLLATCSEDHSIKLWRIPENGLPCQNEASFSSSSTEPEVLIWHPTVDCILATSNGSTIKIWDVSQQEQLYNNSLHEDLVQSFSWKSDGSTLVSSGKDCKLKIWDPRSKDVSQETKSQLHSRDSRVLWLGDTDYVLSTGFGASLGKGQISLRDVRYFSDVLITSSFDSSLNVFVPLFDPDTNMLFLSAKAETVLHYLEVTFKEPFFVEGTKHVGDVQAKGVALVPKRALDTMQAEVNRILMLGQDCIVPIAYQVPRKSYREYHTDLYPDTKSTEPALSLDDWLNGKNEKVKTISLNPQKKSRRNLLKFGHTLNSIQHSEPTVCPTVEKEDIFVDNNISKTDFDVHSNSFSMKIDNTEKDNRILESFSTDIEKPIVPPKPKPPNSNILVKEKIANFSSREKEVQMAIEKESYNQQTDIITSCVREKANNLEQSQLENRSSAIATSPSPHRTSRTFGVRVAKFRHLNGTVLHKNTHITNIINLNKTIANECDGFHANSERVAFPLSIAGGHVAILELNKPGRLPSNNLPNVVCGSTVTDFAWDPFNKHRLALGTDSGKVHISYVPEDGLEDERVPDETSDVHDDRISILKFHPTAEDVVTTASYDLTVRIWNLSKQQLCITLEGHMDQIFSLAWSPDGQYLATVCKDQKLRIYNPRKSSTPIQEGPGPNGKRGARVVWVLGDSHLVVSGFSKVSERQIALYNVNNLSEPLNTIGIDVNPSILVPFYDEGSCTLFLTGKGESTIFAYEVSTDFPHFFPLSHYKCSGPHQAISFLPKHICNVAEVEFARAIRLTNTSIEPISFTVPRLRTEYFQDDLFPDTRVNWEPLISGEEWFSGVDVKPKFISLKPEGMLLLSEAPQKTAMPPVSAPPETVILYEGQMTLESSLSFLSGGKEKQERIISSMKDKMSFHDDKLPQESFEGVDPDEWDEDH